MPDLVLVTGATGHIGFAVLTEILKKGYTVRATLRRESAIDQISSEAVIKPYLSRLTFSIVPDITITGAFDEALTSVTHIVHIASPLPKPGADAETGVIGPAVSGTTSILMSALREPSVRKVVITASVFSVRSEDATPTDVLHPDTIVNEPQGPYPNDFSAYAASKAKAHLAVSRIIAQERPSFSVISVMPSFVIGPNLLAKTPEKVQSGSNQIVLGLLLGAEQPTPISQFVHIDDVAFVHAAALDDNIKGVKNFGLGFNGYDGGVDVQQAIEIVRTKLAKEVEEGIFPLEGRTDVVPSRFDTRRTEEVFGFRQKDFETMVIELAEYYAKVCRQT